VLTSPGTSQLQWRRYGFTHCIPTMRASTALCLVQHPGHGFIGTSLFVCRTQQTCRMLRPDGTSMLHMSVLTGNVSHVPSILQLLSIMFQPSLRNLLTCQFHRLLMTRRLLTCQCCMWSHSSAGAATWWVNALKLRSSSYIQSAKVAADLPGLHVAAGLCRMMLCVGQAVEGAW
jgi:hypothetical protein